MAADALLVIPTDVYVRGNLRADGYSPPDNSIGTDAFDIGRPLSTLKVGHQYLVKFNPSGTPVTEAKTVHQAYSTGTLVQVSATVTGAGVGAATVTVGVKKNGVSVLSAAFVLSSALAAYGIAVASLNSALAGYVANDAFEVTCTVAAPSGTLPTGLLVTLLFREAAGS